MNRPCDLPIDSEEWHQCEQFILQRFGLFFSSERQSTLRDGVCMRMAIIGSPSLGDYVHRLLRHTYEANALVDYLTVGESFFYREPDQFKVMVDYVAGRLSPVWDGVPVRILSAGCSTGEEAYSVAMALLDAVGEPHSDRIEILGIDVNGYAIAMARKGCFGSYSLRHVHPDLRVKYFRPVGDDCWQVTGRANGMVRFHVVNLCHESLVGSMSAQDIIFYRNVSIYLDDQAQSYVFRQLCGRLRPGGLLFMGAAETYVHSQRLREDDCLRSCWRGMVFYFCKDELLQRESSVSYTEEMDPSRVEDDLRSSCPDVVADVTGRSDKAVHEGDEMGVNSVAELSSLGDVLLLARERQFAHALVLLEQAPSIVDDSVAIKACLLLNLGRIVEVKALCASILEKDPWHLASHLMLGLVANHEQDREEACRRFKTAVYIQPDSWLPHYYMAEWYLTAGERRQAVREWDVTIHQLHAHGLEKHGLPFLPLRVSQEEILQMCCRRRTATENKMDTNGFMSLVTEIMVGS
ncbi:MAG: hypothetical protein HQL07_02110 [Nitrospirae bacterium]|nr:hypothetical protein [Magnetococcales bacterium]